ncbi:MAG TPA: hypothetical protein VKJ67_24210 [Methylomirabilota bacterium]|nr:hypothetical protein [Methylomirabilota bacterium]
MPTPSVSPSATYPCTSLRRPAGATSTARVYNAVVPMLNAAPVSTRFAKTTQPVGVSSSAAAHERSTRASARGSRRPKASTIQPQKGRTQSWATPVAPSMKPMRRAS